MTASSVPDVMAKRLVLIVLFGFAQVGVAGCEGPVGPKGEPGNPRIVTRIVEYGKGDVALQANEGRVSWEVAEIDAMVFQDGLVAAYIETDAGWLALPFEMAVGSASTVSSSIRVGFVYAIGLFDLVFSKNGSPIVRDDLPVGRVKIVVVPPGS